MDGIVALLLSKKFTKDTVIGMGAIKGAACQVQSINKVGKTTTITLKWEDNVGVVHTQAFDIEDGLDGISIQNATIKPNGHLELTLSDGNTIDCGKVLPQYDTMPTPSSSNEGQILQYIGTTTSNYTNGYFYECINDGGTYKWVEKSVQDSYTKIEIGDLSQLPDNTKNVVENIIDIDNKIDNKENLFRYSIMPTANVDNVGDIVEYIGTTNTNYTNGYFYQCRFDGTNYSWVQKDVQPSGGGTGSDNVVEGYFYNNLFYEEIAHINPISGAENVIYISLDTNLLYRYDTDNSIFIRVDEHADGQTIQVDTMPVASIDELGNIYQFVGTTTSTYTNGYFYKCVENSGIYSWERINTQDSYTKEEIGNLTNLPDNTKNVVENISDLDNNKENVFRYAHSVDIPTASATNVGTIIQYIGTTTADYVSGFFYQSQLDTDTSTYKWVNIEIQPASGTSAVESVNNKTGVVVLDAEDIGLQVSTMPTADIDHLNQIVQYIGTTSVTYINGYWYKCVYDSVGSTYSWEQINVQPHIAVDSALSDTSENPVQNKVIYDALGDKVDTSSVGVASGVASLDSSGKVPSAQLPSYVDDVIEGYKDGANFYTDSAHTDLITPESSKIYVDLHTDTTWRWSGTAYVQISESLALGETSTTAYRGDRGKTAYDHSQITSGNPHNVTATDVGLGNVTNTGDSDTPVSGGTTKFTTGGAYTELNKKADKVSSATNGHLAGLDGNGNLTDSEVVANDVIQKVATATGLLKDDGTVDTTTYAPSNKAYLTDDTAETTIDDADYFPFYDTSATGKRKTLFSSIVNKLKNTFATLVTGTFTAGNLVSLDSSGNIADSNISSNDIRKTTTLSNVTSSDVIFKISGFGLNTGSLFVIRARGGENILFALGNSSQDVAISYGYSAFRISGNSAYKINAMTYDYANNELYVNLGNYSILSIIQISGVTKYNLTITSVNSIPTTDIYEIPIQNLNSKIDKVSATQNDIAIFDANGGVADSNVLISSLPTIAPTPVSGLTEKDVVDEVNSATATNANAPSLYGVQKYSNEKTVRRVLNGANIPSGTSMTATGIGTWTDKAIDQITSADETDWWYDSAFVVPVYYMLTSDTSIVTGKTYYTRSGTAPNYTYTVVASPVVADIGTYYEQYSDDVDISIKFDPSGDTATLGGYIFDSTTGKICIKFGNSITVNTARIAVDITYTRNEVG